MMHHGNFRTIVLLGLAAVLAAAPCRVVAQSPALDRLSVHGYLSQAYAIADTLQILGISPRGTADYRKAALQFRYDATGRDAFVVQFSHERFGQSSLQAVEPDVEVDWVFYEHRFGDYTTARVGKIKTPIGIYNEIRDVGVLLPLYRPPSSAYEEFRYTSETVSGASVGQRIPLGAWTVSLDGFFGAWHYVQWDMTTIADVENAVGAQVWLYTPLDGLRVGGAVNRFHTRNVLLAPADTTIHQLGWYGSVDASFERFMVRGEYSRVTTYQILAKSYYAQLGVNLTSRWSLIGQADFLDLHLEGMGLPVLDQNFDRDLAVALRFAPRPDLVLKLEGHRYRGYNIEPVTLNPYTEQRIFMNYALFSLSTSF